MTEVLDSNTKEKLKAYVASIEKLENDKTEILEQMRDIFKDAANDGFDVKIIKTVLKLRKMKKEDRIENEELISLYKAALDMDD